MKLKKNSANYIGLRKKLWGIGFGEKAWRFFYHRTIKHLGGTHPHLVPQTDLAELAHPFYNQFARGGEGHLEVGKNVYYTIHKLCHMVLALKPFGCMPSSQSDGVQSAVVNKFKDMIFLPIETSGEGEVNAHSRVQMALGEAKVKAKTEFEQCLKSTGKSMEADPRIYCGASRAAAAVLPRASPRRNCRNCSPVHFACERSHQQKHASLEALARLRDRRAGRRLSSGRHLSPPANWQLSVPI